jgi:hypothetical protein
MEYHEGEGDAIVHELPPSDLHTFPLASVAMIFILDLSPVHWTESQ